MKRIGLILLALVLCLSTAVWAAEQTHVVDLILCLSNDQWLELNEQAEEGSGECGVYLIILDDFRDYASSPQSCAETLYRNNGYGVGADADGILLLLSMDDRDYAIVGHGPLGRTAVELVDDNVFLDDFRYDDWYSGFADYIDECSYAIGLAKTYGYTDISGADGPQAVIVPQPMPTGSRLAASFPMILLGSAVVSLIVCLILLAQMKTARKQSGADAYVPDRGVEYRIRTDLYTHTTRSVRHVPKNNSSSGGGGGGFSGRSGKF